MEFDSQAAADAENQSEECNPSELNENGTQPSTSELLPKHKDADDNDDSLSYYVSMSG